MSEGLSAQKKAPIYISRLLAIIFIHKTESIIFISNFIIKKIKIVHFHHMQCYAKSVETIDLGIQKKAPRWDLFFAAQFLWPQRFLHSIWYNIYGPIHSVNNKTSKKIN